MRNQVFRKPLLIAVLFASLLATARCTAKALPPSRTDSEQDQLRQQDGDKAKATGIVLENNQGCHVDASCYLQLRVGSEEVRVIYHPGEGKVLVNKAAYQQGISVKKGAHVKVYGRYSKRGNTKIIETFSSAGFYIHVLPN